VKLAYRPKSVGEVDWGRERHSQFFKSRTGMRKEITSIHVGGENVISPHGAEKKRGDLLKEREGGKAALHR